jgi:hypothetical protein
VNPRALVFVPGGKEEDWLDKASVHLGAAEKRNRENRRETTDEPIEEDQRRTLVLARWLASTRWLVLARWLASTRWLVPIRVCTSAWGKGSVRTPSEGSRPIEICTSLMRIQVGGRVYGMLTFSNVNNGRRKPFERLIQRWRNTWKCIQTRKKKSTVFPFLKQFFQVQISLGSRVAKILAHTGGENTNDQDLAPDLHLPEPFHTTRDAETRPAHPWRKKRAWPAW